MADSATAQQAIEVGVHGGSGQNSVIVVPYGAGSNDNAFSVKILGWRHVNADNDNSLKSIWIPTVLAEFTGCILSSTYPGLASHVVTSNELFCDTITAAAIGPTTSVEVTSPTGDLGIAHAVVAIKGVEKIEFIFDQTTGTPSMNCLIAFI